jgi:hypothetical protein
MHRLGHGRGSSISDGGWERLARHTAADVDVGDKRVVPRFPFATRVRWQSGRMRRTTEVQDRELSEQQSKGVAGLGVRRIGNLGA